RNKKIFGNEFFETKDVWERSLRVTDGFFIDNLGKAIRNGLSLAWQLNIGSIEIESVSEIAIKLIDNDNTINIALSTIVNDCKSLLLKFITTSLKHIFKEGNRCTD
ncbi:hypothetical protein Gohar_007472, partial [Gossypium harknessii]|nr:hypothetical protein [Gossypium harknessii]